MQLPGMDFAEPQGPSVSIDFSEILSWEKYLYLRKKSEKLSLPHLSMNNEV